jgi:hypothetical protein
MLKTDKKTKQHSLETKNSECIAQILVYDTITLRPRPIPRRVKRDDQPRRGGAVDLRQRVLQPLAVRVRKRGRGFQMRGCMQEIGVVRDQLDAGRPQFKVSRIFWVQDKYTQI